MVNMAEVSVVEVRIWGRTAGAVAPLHGKPGFYEFQYTPAFENGGLELSPLYVKLKAKQRFSFPALAQDTFHGLPGLLADALPDKFGNALIDEYLSRHGTPVADITTLQRLVYVGRRAMGALEFEPSFTATRTPSVLVSLDMAHLVEGPPGTARRPQQCRPRDSRYRQLRGRRPRQSRDRLESANQ